MGQRLSVGDTLSEVLRIYREQAGVLLPVAFWLFLVVAIVDGLTEGQLSLFWLGIVIGLAVGTSIRGWSRIRGGRSSGPSSSPS
jgi:hypothetical protein